MVSVDDFKTQIDNVKYKGEVYSARDNGCVLRYPKDKTKPRQLDNNWTFGKQNSKTGYMEIAGARIHRIIATAFLGEAPSKEHLVDHIDTNRANNRPENLRWVTKLENAILNPITAKKIASVCGSVEEFLKDPAKYRDRFSEPNISWMCLVSKDEAQNCLNNFKNWVNKDKQVKGGGIGNWIFEPQKNNSLEVQEYKNFYNFGQFDESEYVTKNAKQDWSTQTKFTCCPEVISDTPLKDYYDNLKKAEVFGENRYTTYEILKVAFCDTFIIVLTEDKQEKPIKPWCVIKITFEDGYFCHYIVKSCFEKYGAEKYYTIEQGLEWDGPDCFDDYA